MALPIISAQERPDAGAMRISSVTKDGTVTVIV